MTSDEAVKWLTNLRNDIGAPYYSALWHYEQALAEIADLIQDQQDEMRIMNDVLKSNTYSGYDGSFIL